MPVLPFQSLPKMYFITDIIIKDRSYGFEIMGLIMGLFFLPNLCRIKLIMLFTR